MAEHTAFAVTSGEYDDLRLEALFAPEAGEVARAFAKTLSHGEVLSLPLLTAPPALATYARIVLREEITYPGARFETRTWHRHNALTEEDWNFLVPAGEVRVTQFELTQNWARDVHRYVAVEHVDGRKAEAVAAEILAGVRVVPGPEFES